MATSFDLASEQKRLSTLFAEVNSASQTLYSGFLQVDKTADDDATAAATDAQVQLVWGKKDLVNNTTHKFHVQYHVSNVCGDDSASSSPAAPTRVHRGIFPSSYDAVLTSVSPSRRFVVTLKLDKSASSSAATDAALESVFSLYENSKFVTTFRAPASLHGTIYTGEREGGFVWSHDETRIAYVAERKKAPSAEPKPFWTNVNSAADKKDMDDDAAVLPGNKYVHEDDWGEQYVGKKTGVIFIATLASGHIEAVQGIPLHLTCADVQFTPHDDALVFAGTATNDPKRLGIIYCYNRPIHLYTVSLTHKAPEATLLAFEAVDQSAALIATSRSPRFSPDGQTLAFLATRDVVTHNTCSSLALMDWTTKRVTTLIDIVDEPAAEASKAPATAFNGLFTGALSHRAWSNDGQRIVVDTQVGSRILWKLIDVGSHKIVSPSYVDGAEVGSETLLDTDGDRFFLVSVTSPVRPASVFLVEVDHATGQYNRTPIAIEDQRRRGTQHIASWHILSIPTSVSDDPAAAKALVKDTVPQDLLLPSVTSDAAFEATLLVPASSSPPAAGFPVVMDLHGGPHGNSPATYRVLYEFFAAMGFAVVTVNYRGSTGYGRAPLESLVGKVGTQDVFDCHFALQHILQTSGVALDAARLHCSGGSHGGFLVSHLIAQFPGVYKSTVARNPVTNIASMFYQTDIPDWTLGATGVKRFEAITTTQALQQQANDKTLAPLTPNDRLAILAKLWRHSPVGNDLATVTTPILFGIGGKDRRVPPTQGLELRDALMALGVETRLLFYPDDNHPLDTVQAYGDFSINWGLWVLQHNQ